MRMLRRALESEDTTGEEVSIVMKGPLADNYTQALNVAYAKGNQTDGTPEGEAVSVNIDDPVAMESAAQDVTIMQKMLSQVVAAPETGTTSDDYMTVYGVNKENVGEQEIVEVTQMLAQADKADMLDNFVLIVDGTLPGTNGDQSSPPQERFVNLTPGLESIAASYGVKVYSSLAEFARSR